jgi:transposase
MGKANFSDEFKRDAVAQITERGYRVAEGSERLGVSQHSLYAWKRQFAQRPEDASKDAPRHRRRWDIHPIFFAGHRRVRALPQLFP